MVETAVILFNMGAPSDDSEIKPYLKRVFADPDLIRLPARRLLAPIIISARLKKVKEKYAEIGNSPLLRICREQARDLTLSLNRTGRGDFRVFLGMRYSEPSIEDAVHAAIKSRARQIVALPLYPQYCSATTGSAITELERVIATIDPKPAVKLVDRYPTHPGYIEALSRTVRPLLKKHDSDPFVVFSAHGIPEKLHRGGDPYVSEVQATSSAVAQRLGLKPDRWQLTFQSRLGPLKWVGPYSEEYIDTLAQASVSELIIVPISFTADNLETLYDIDRVLVAHARNQGIGSVKRAPTLNGDATFIGALAELVQSK